MSTGFELDPRLRGLEMIKRTDTRTGHAGGRHAGQPGYAPGQRQTEVSILSCGVDRPQVHTEVLWPGPPSGPQSMEIDVYPVSALHIHGDTIPDGFIDGAMLLCPLCTWMRTDEGPMKFRGQTMLSAKEEVGSRFPTFTMWFDERNRFNVLETVKCGWIPCGWTTQIRGGVAYPIKGKDSRRYSYVPK